MKKNTTLDKLVQKRRLVQIHHRITCEQDKYIKKFAKQKGISEAEAVRYFINIFMDNK